MKRLFTYLILLELAVAPFAARASSACVYERDGGLDAVF